MNYERLGIETVKFNDNRWIARRGEMMVIGKTEGDAVHLLRKSDVYDTSMTESDDWQPIGIAPKDGRWIEIYTDKNCVYVMRWNDGPEGWEVRDYKNKPNSESLPIKWRPKLNDWRSIETAPKDGTAVDLFLWGGRAPNCYYDSKRGEWCMTLRDGYIDEVIGPTHWMPIPNPPTKEGPV